MPDLSGEKTLEGLTVKDSTFAGAEAAILLDQTIKGAFIANNSFSGVQHAVVVANDRETEVQIVAMTLPT